MAKSRVSIFRALIIVLMTMFFLLPFGKVSGQNCSVNAGIPQTICANDPLILYGSKSGSFPGSPVTLWTQVSGPAASIALPNSLVTAVTNITGNTTLTFRLETTCLDGSLVYQDVTYTILPVGNPYAGPDRTYCPGQTGPLAATPAAAGETGLWTGSGNGITVDHPGDYNSTLTISGSSAGSTTLRWTVTNNTSHCSAYDDVIITNLGGITVDAGPEQTLANCYSTTQSTSLEGSYAGTFSSGQGGTWTVVSGPNVPTIANIHQNNTGVSGLIEGNYVFRWEVVGPCTSGSDLVTIHVPAATASVTGTGTQAGPNIRVEYCDGRTSTFLTGPVPLYVNETVLWTQVLGAGLGPALPAGSIVNPALSVTEVKNLNPAFDYRFQYTITNPLFSCATFALTTVAYYRFAPTLTINSVDPIVLPCNTSTASIDYTEGGSGTTEFSVISGPAGTGYTYPSNWLIAPSNPLNITGLTKSGTYVIQMRRYTTENVSCVTQYDQITVVTSFAGEAANAGTDQILDCNVTTTALQGNDPLLTGVGQGTWSQVSGPSTILIAHPSHHNPTLTINGLIPGSLYVFRWIVTGGPGCPDTQDDVTVITATAVPLAVDAGPNQSVCTNTPVLLNATAKTHIFEIATWTVVPSAGVVFSDIHDRKATVTGLQPFTTYTFTWTISNGCGSASDFLTIDVSDTNGPKASIAGPDQCLATAPALFTLTGNDPSPGTGQWNQLAGGPNIATISNTTLYNATINNMVVGTYTFEWVISRGGCVPTRDTVVVTVNPPGVTPANAGADKFVCGSTTTLSASGSNPAAGSTAVWTQTGGSGGVTIVSPTSATTNITGLQAGGESSAVYRFQYTITNGACVSSDEVTVFVSDPGSPAVIPLASATVCGASSVVLTADAITAGTGIWEVVSGPNTPSFAAGTRTSATTTVNNLITGSYRFRWTVTGGTYCTPSSDEIDVTVTMNANAGADQSYCESVTSVNLSGTTSSVGTWTQVGSTPKAATITTTSTNTATASDLTLPGVYTFQYAISVAGCTSTDQMTVTIYSPPSIANAGTDRSLCNQAAITMAADVPLSGTGTWSVLLRPAGDTGTFTNVNVNNTTYTPTAGVFGLYVFQWTVANSTCSNADQVRINNYAAPSPSVPGANQNVTCSTSTVMAATNPASGTGTWTFDSKTGSGPTPVISNPLLYNTTITGLGPKADFTPETYTFKWTVTNGSCPPNESTMTITVYQTPTIATAGPDQALCNQTSVLLAGNNPTVGTGTWTQISPAHHLETFAPNANTNNATVNNLDPGKTYVFRWTTATASCSTFDEVTIVNSALPSTADVSATVTSYCTLVPIALVGNAPVTGTGSWEQISGPTLSIPSPNAASTYAYGGTVGNAYQFRYSISNGTCTPSTADVTVNIYALPSQALAGSDQMVCDVTPATTITMNGNAPVAPITGEWTKVSGPASYDIHTPTSPTTVIDNLQPGTYVFRWTHINGTCTKSDDMQVTAYGATTVSNAGIAQTRCNVTTFTMAANTAGSGETGTWVRISGPNNPTITAVNSPTTTITGTIPGTYVFRWRITSGTCPTYSESFVTITNRTAISLTGPSSASVCEDGTQTLSVSASGGTGSYNYQWQYFSGAWTPVGPNSNSYTPPTFPAHGTYDYRVIVTDQVPSDEGGCSTTSATATITVVVDPTITGQPSSPAAICVGGTTANMTVTATGGTPLLTYQWQYFNVTWGNVSAGVPAGATYTGGTSASMSVAGITSATTHDYRCLVSATGNHCVTAISNTVTVTVIPDPAISSHPASITICSGSTTTLTVTATGGTPALHYQWQSSANGTSGWTNVGTDSPSYLTAALTVTTYYHVIITAIGSDCNTITSNTAKVSIPHVTTQPVATTNICDGGTATLSVVAGSDGGTASYTYQWEYFNVTWGNAPGVSTNSNYTTPVLASPVTYQYRCIITTATPSCTITSNTANVVAVADPAIPIVADRSICVGGTTILTVAPTGGVGAFLYQWESAANCGGAFAPIALATSASYTPPGATLGTAGTYYYHCVVTQTASGCSTTSNCITLTVVPKPAITVQPASFTTICSGTTTTLSVTATGGTPSLDYQWQYNTTGCGAGSWNNILVGGNSSTYTTAHNTQTYYYRVLVSATGSGCTTIISDCATVYMPRITTEPSASNPEICVGGTSTLSVVTETGNPAIGYSYQWQYYNSTTSTWNNVADATPAGALYTNATTASMTVAGMTPSAAHLFRVVIQVTSPACTELTSSSVTVTVKNDPGISGPPVEGTVCNGSTYALHVTATGGTPSLNYQWQVSSSDSPYVWADVSTGTGGQTKDYTTAGLTTNKWYKVNITATGSDCNTISSTPVKVTVNNLSPGTIGGAQTICENGTPTGLTNTGDATAVEAGAVISYQWQSHVLSGSYSDILTATNATYSPGPLTVDTWYRRVATSTLNAVACSSNSNEIIVTVNNLTAGVIAADQTICSGSDVAAFTVSTAATADGIISYQWQISTDGAIYSNIPVGGTSATYDEGTLTSDRWYQRIATSTLNTVACSKTSNVIHVFVNNLDPGSISGGETICSGGDPAIINSAGAYSGDGTLSYTWYYRTSATGLPPTGWTAIGSSNTASYDPPSGLTADRFYSRLTTSVLNTVSCTAASNIIAVYVNNLTPGTIQSAQTICDGGTANLLTTATAPTADGTISYQWEISTTSGVAGFSDIALNGTNASYQPLSQTQDTWYRRRIISTFNTILCTATSPAIQVTVINFTSTNTIGTAQTICNGTTASLTGNAVTGDAAAAYVWQFSTDNATYNPVVPAGTSQNYTTNSLTQNTWFRRVATMTVNTVPCSITSAPLLVTVNNLSPGTIGGAQTICENGTPTGLTNTGDATAVEAGSVITYQWQSHVAAGSYANILTATNATYSPGALTVDTWYRRVATSTLNSVACSSNSNEIIVTVNNLTAGTISSAQTLCENSSASLTGTLPTFDGTVTYQWQSSPDNSTWSNAAGTSTNQNYTTAALTADTYFQRIVKSTLSAIECTKTSPSILVTIINFDPGSIAGDQTICSGTNNAVLTSSATGTGDGTFSYLWERSLIDSPYSWTSTGVTTVTYPATAHTADTWYRRRTRANLNSTDCDKYSNVIRVTVNNLTSGTIQSAQTICEGDIPALLTTAIAATNDGTLTYQWEISTTSSSSGFSDIALNGTNETYQPLPLIQDTWYRRRAISTLNLIACSATTAAIQITVNNFTSANTISADQNICYNTTASLTGNIVAGDGSITYQWKSSTDNNSFSNVATGGTLQDYTTSALTQDTWFRRVATSTQNSVACTLTSTSILVSVKPIPSVTSGLVQTICTNTAASLTLTTSPDVPGTTFSWPAPTISGVPGNITGGTARSAPGTTSPISNTLVNTTSTPQTATYIVTPTGPTGCVGTTRNVVITVNPSAQVNIPANQVVCNNASTTLVTFGTTRTGGTTTYTWANDNTAIGLAAASIGNVTGIPSFTATNSGTLPITANITVTPTFTNGSVSCSGTSQTFTITVNPSAQVNIPANQVICNSGSTTSVTFSTTRTGGTTTYTWANDNTAIGLAASSAGNSTGIPSFTATNNGTAPITGTITITPTFTNGSVSCSGTAQTFTITVNPTAQVNQPTSQVVCNNSGTSTVTFGTGNSGGTTTYSWTNDQPSIGLAASGTNTPTIPSFTATNSGSTPVVATIVVTPSFTNGSVSCTGSSKTFTITVNPSGQVNVPANQVVCNGASTSLVTFGTTRTGGTTTYTWANDNTSIGLAAASVGNVTGIPSFTATNSGTSPISGTITITPTFTNGSVSCSGTAQTFTITVNPSAQVNIPANQVVCNGAATSLVTFGTTRTGGTTTYSWTNDQTSIGLAAASVGNATDIPVFTATNNGTSPITASITVTPTFTNGSVSCSGTAQTFTITVNPTAQVNIPANQVVCNLGSSSLVTFSTTRTGGTTTYTWANDNTAIGLAASSSGNVTTIPVFTATNSGTLPIMANITITPTFTNGSVSCLGTAQTFTITVNPTAQVNDPADQVVCNGASTSLVTFGTTNTGGTTTYTWTNDNTTIGLAASGSGNISAFIATNMSSATVTATITVTPHFENGSISCTGSAQTFTITVKSGLAPIITGNIPETSIEGCSSSVVPSPVTTAAALESMGLIINDASTPDTGLVITSHDIATGTCPVTVIRTYTVTNDCGLSSTVIQTYKVTDNTAPVVSCPVGQQIRETSGLNTFYFAAGSEFDATAFSDNCVIVSISNNLNHLATLNGYAFPVGPTQVIWTATDLCGNQATCSFYVTVSQLVADLAITKTASPHTVSAGDLASFLIVVTNLGPGDALSVSVTDAGNANILNPQFSLNNGATWSNWTGTYIYGNLAANGTFTLLMRGSVSPSLPVGTILPNTATVSSPTRDPVPGNNTSTDHATVTGSADLSIVKQGTPHPVAAGQVITYTISTTNNGPSDALNVVTTDAVPSTIRNPEFSINGGISWSAWTGSYNWGTLAALANHYLVIRGTVSPDQINGTLIRNTATVSSPTPDPVPGNNTSVDEAPVNTNADLSITKVSTPNPVLAGQVITYTITVTNPGYSDAQGVQITDMVPGSILTPEYSVDNGSSWRAWVSPYNAGTIAAGNHFVLLIRGVVIPDAVRGLVVANTASVSSSTADPNPVNNTVTDQNTITVPHPNLLVTKSALDNIFSAVGDIVHYRIIVYNNNIENLYNITVSDSNAIITSGSPIARLDAGKTAEVFASHTVTQSDIDAGEILNTVTANGNNVNAVSVKDKSNLVSIKGTQRPQITVTKYVAETRFKSVGETIHYSMEVFNCGNVTLKNILVYDPNATIIGTKTFASLAPRATATVNAVHIVTQADVAAGKISNTAYVEGFDQNNLSVKDDSNVVTLFSNQPDQLSIVKLAKETTFKKIGDTIHYEMTLKNYRSTYLSNIWVYDATAVITTPIPIFRIETDNSVLVKAYHVVTQKDLDAGKVVNIAVARGTDYFGYVDQEYSNEVTVFAGQQPGLILTKTADESSYQNVGDLIHYSNEIRNEGNVKITGIVLTDPDTHYTGSNQVSELNPGDSVTIRTVHTVTQTDLNIGNIEQTATLSGLDVNSQPIRISSNSLIVNGIQTADISANLTAAENTFKNQGDVIHYTVSIRNTGNITLTKLGISAAGAIIQSGSTINDLLPGYSAIFTAEHLVSIADLTAGKLSGQATITGLKPDGSQITRATNELTLVAGLVPGLSVTTVATESSYRAAGETIHYAITVRNTGNANLTNIRVTDLNAQITDPVISLAPFGSATVSATHTVTQSDIDSGEIANMATITGQYPDGTPIDHSTNPVTIYAVSEPRLNATIYPVESSYHTAGDLVNFTIEVTNTGNLTISNITLAPLGELTITGTPADGLTPGQKALWSGVYEVKTSDLDAGKVARSVDVTGTDPHSQPLRVSSNQTIVAAVQIPELSATSTATEAAFTAAGDILHYNIVVTNTGNVSIISTSVTDPNAVIISVRPNVILMPGESFPVLATHLVTQEDMDAGKVVTMAKAEGFDLAGHTIGKLANQVTIAGLQRTELGVTSTASSLIYNKVGELVNYHIEVKNTGNISLYNVEVTNPGVVIDANNTATSLLPGESLITTASHTITQDDLDAGEFVNTSKATATDSNGKPIIKIADQQVVTGVQQRELTVVTAASVPNYKNEGDVIRYTVVVKNTGNVTMKNVSATDVKDLLNFNRTLPSLAPGEMDSLTADHTVTRADINAGRIVTAGIAIGFSNSRKFSFTGNETTVKITIENYNLANYPNPFAYETTITFDLPEKGKVILKVFDITGQEVGQVDQQDFNQGRNYVTWKTRNEQKGQYILKMYYNGQTAVKMVTIIN